MVVEKIIAEYIILGVCLISLLSLASALTISSVSTSPSEIEPGESADVVIKIENDANNDIEDVSVSLDLTEVPFAPFDSSSEQSFNEILEDRSKEAEFEIVALSDASSGIYKIPVKITYTEDTQLKTKSSLISMTVSSEPILGASVEDGLVLKGQENEITIKIVNKGLSDVKFLEVKLGSSSYYSLLSQGNVYVGNIDSDDFDTVNFKLFFRENAPSSINLLATIIYKDALNNKYEEDFSLDLRVYTREKAVELGLIKQSNTAYYVLGAIVLIIIWIIYRKIKKRRKMKKSIVE